MSGIMVLSSVVTDEVKYLFSTSGIYRGSFMHMVLNTTHVKWVGFSFRRFDRCSSLVTGVQHLPFLLLLKRIEEVNLA